MDINSLIQSQREFFATGATRDINFRRAMLRTLREAILREQDAIVHALGHDLKKSHSEALEGELFPVLSEISYALKHMHSWSKPRRVPGPSLFPFARGYTQSMPYGVVAIFSPYNHPFSTSLTPLVSAIAAGNCILLKPSELVPTASHTLTRILESVFPAHYISSLEGERDVSEAIMAGNIDSIFFTGSTAVGRLVMEASAKKPIPVTLQLGGKCPGIVHSDADLKRAAARIAWGKFWNAGQSCNTTDHIYVHTSVKEKFVAYLIESIKQFYSQDPHTSSSYGRIVNQRHFERITSYLGEGHVLYGGESDITDLYIAPTIMDEVKPDSRLHGEEIFGPILPLYAYDDLDDVLHALQATPKPLAVYVFSREKRIQEKIVHMSISGTVCVNDLMIQASTPTLPIGGVGQSGFGRMHGKLGFDAFSYTRSVLKNNGFDLPLRFPPHRHSRLLQFIGRFL